MNYWMRQPRPAELDRTCIADGKVPYMGRRLEENVNKLRDVSPKFFLPSTFAPLLVDHVEPHVYMDEWSVQPFNGQVQRIAAISALAKAFEPTIAIETGTYLGSSTPYLAGLSARGAVTIEIDDFAADRAERRFRRNHHTLAIQMLRGDSATTIKQVLSTLEPRTDRILAYLDAHWLDQIPTHAELEALDAWGDSWIAVIDDFHVPDDPGYGHDAYGDVVIGPGIVPDREHLQVWVVAAPSDTETGALRGTGVVLPAGISEQLPAFVLQLLRRIR